MSSKFIVVVDILGCNFIVTDLILHLNICTTALGKKNMLCFNKMFPWVAYFCGQKKDNFNLFSLYIAQSVFLSFLYIDFSELNN